MLNEFIKASQLIGGNPAYVQGGGGNSSIKMDNDKMYIKASGFVMKEINEDSGLAIVDCHKIKCSYKNFHILNPEQAEKKAVKNIVDNTLSVGPRASIETGLHSFLDKVVMHTHSVYVNILTCSKEGKNLASSLFSAKYPYLWIEYANPGASLACLCKKKIDNFVKKYGFLPQVIFLKNHGFFISGDNVKNVIKVHDDINSSLKKYFKISEKYPAVELKKIDEISWESQNKFFKKWLNNNDLFNFFKKIALFPDQVVYFRDETIKKIEIKGKNKVVYHCSFKEAKTLEETIVSLIYIYSGIKRNKLTPSNISIKNKKYILNMESEKYRQNILKK